MFRFTPILCALALASCGPGTHGPRIGIADGADAGTTAVAMATGATETNLIAASAGPLTPVALIALKYGVKASLIKAGVAPRKANHSVETLSVLGAGANIITIAGGPLGLAIGGGLIWAVCYFNGAKA